MSTKHNQGSPTRCANCGTTEGPFVRDPQFPGLPVCGFPPRYHASVALRAQRTLDCLQRRSQPEQSGLPEATAA